MRYWLYTILITLTFFILFGEGIKCTPGYDCPKDRILMYDPPREESEIKYIEIKYP
mgnify:CR=1 FL=1